MFTKLGIDYSRPGFYDSVEFRKVEKDTPAFISAYGGYVDSLELSADYLKQARALTLEAATFLFEELKKDGRKGACIDASGTLQRFLDRDGVWNYMVGGAARIRFPAEDRIPDQHYWPLVHPDNPAQTGHSWVSAPPFKVIDITLPLQGYPPEIARHFEGFIAGMETTPSEARGEDLYETELIEYLIKRHGRPPTLNDLHTQQREFMRDFPAFEMRYRALGLKYVPMQITAIDGDMEQMRNLCLSGKYPADLYAEFLSRRAK